MFNKYDILIILLITSLAFGGVGGAFQVVRVLAVIFSLFFFASYSYNRNYLSPYLLCFCFFYVFCLFSMAWTPDFNEGIKELAYYPIHILLFLEIISFSRLAKSSTHAVSIGWMVAVCLTLVVALWEIITGHHLSVSDFKSELLINTGTGFVVRRYASVTFGNFNSYVTFLCFAFPFLFYRISVIRGVKIRAFYPVLVVLLAALCILYNASRGGVVTLIGMSIIFVLMNSKSKYTLPLTLLLVVAAGYILYSNDSILAAINARSTGGRMFNPDSRYNIWVAAVRAFASSYGLGVGIGGMETSMAQFTTGVAVAHNLFLELLVQYGIIFLIVFLFYLVQLYKRAIKLKNDAVKTTLLMALVTMPVYGIIDSGYLLTPGLFVLLGSLTAFADDERTQYIRKTIQRIIQ